MAVETTQANLLWAVREGADSQACSRFYHLYAVMVRNFARRIGLPDADADDVTQEVLIIAHKALQEGTYDPARGRFRQWLYGVARRQALVRLRDRRRRTRAQWVSDRGGFDLLDQLEGRVSDAEAIALWQQEWRYALLDEAMQHVQGQVGDKAFQAFTMYAIERRPVEEVAATVGIATSSVYVYKARVLAAIRQWVGQFEPDDAL